jgi:triosephosphate isomerase
MSLRKPFVAGNWKMNLERKTALGLALAVRDAVGRRDDVDVAVFPPFVYLDEIARALAGSMVRCGAQNCSDEPSGAFTGEISPAMLVDVGATHVLLGHSERRHIYGEGNELVGRKVKLALESGLSPILCVGETLEERDAKRTEHVVGEQLARGLSGVDGRTLQTRITLAYEPVWAIGTGRNATPAQAGEVHAYMRGVLAGLYNEAAAEGTRILYGGSVKPDNVRALMAVRGVDGVLVGGASLKPDSFLPLLEFR